MPALFANNAATTVASALSNVATSLTVASGKGALFPAITGTDYFMLTLTQSGSETTWEIVKVTARSGDVLTIVRGQEGTTAAAWAVGDKAELRVTVSTLLGFTIDTPSNVTPAQGATNIDKNVALTGSAFSSALASAQSAIQVQVSTSSSFASPFYSSGDQTAGSSFTLPNGIGPSGANMTVSTLYFYRLRYKNARGSYSDWSGPTSFTTAAAFSQFIPAPAATPASAGTSFEGGYYVGLQWNALCQSTTSVGIATGTQTFTIDINQATTPLFYLGQTVEVRSRAVNGPSVTTGLGTPQYSHTPNQDTGPGGRKMVGTVAAGTTGTTLVLTCTSISGSGTYSDWSVMARHRLIVAPKASGEFLNANSMLSPDAHAYWYFNNAVSTMSDTSDGKAVCTAIRANNNAAAIPAAYAVAALTIGGYTDWYIPAIDELTLCHRYLKADSNLYNNWMQYSQNSRFLIGYNGYRGSFSRINDWGTNSNSDPQLAAAVNNSSPQAPAGINFRQGESEAFLGDYMSYWAKGEGYGYVYAKTWTASSSNYSDGTEGGVYQTSTAGSSKWRAVRRSVI